MKTKQEKTVIIENFSKNILKTIDFDMKTPDMRKFQNFSVNPNPQASDYIIVQSDKRIAKINLKTKKMVITKSYPSGAYFHHLVMGQTKLFELTKHQVDELIKQIGKTSGIVGTTVLKVDNSGADELTS